MLSAIVAGYEVAARLGMAVGPMRAGVHPHGTSGTVGAAVAVARLLAPGNEDRIASALEGAASVTLFPCRQPAISGAYVHHLVVGLGVQIAITAGAAAIAGMRPVPETLENYFGPMAGPSFEPSMLLHGLDRISGGWASYEILNNCFKLYPACGHTLPINDAVALLRDRHAIQPEQVEAVRISTYGEAARMTETAPATDLAAKFSVPYVVAVALTTGELGVESFSPALLVDEKIRQLARRVQVESLEELEGRYPSEQPANVTIVTKDGREYRHAVGVPRGDGKNPASRDELHAKALGLLARRFGHAHGERIMDAALSLESGKQLGGLSQVLRKAAR